MKHLVSTDWLEANLENVRIFDASWHLPSTNRNASNEFKSAHIKNSNFFDIDEHSNKKTNLPHMLPKRNYWEKIMSELGVNNSDTDGTDQVFDGGGTLTLALADETGADDTLKLAVFSAAATTDVAIKTTAIENINVAVSALKAGDATVNLAAALAKTVTVSGGDGAAVDDLALGTFYKTVDTLTSTFVG